MACKRGSILLDPLNRVAVVKLSCEYERWKGYCFMDQICLDPLHRDAFEESMGNTNVGKVSVSWII